jgi:hypothetical protein
MTAIPGTPPETTETPLEARRRETQSRRRKFRGVQFLKKAVATAAGGVAATSVMFATAAGPPDGPFKPGVDRWSIKTSVIFDDSVEPKAIEIDKFARMANILSSDTPKKKLFHDVRLRDVAPFTNLEHQEGDIVSTVGYVHYAHRDDNDSDYHIQMNQNPGNTLEELQPCLIVEIPHPEAAADPALGEKFRLARKFIRDHCFEGREPEGRVAVPVQVEVIGQLFYDLHHSPKPGGNPGGGRGKQLAPGFKMSATTCWEIHPVTEIRLPPGR